VYSSLQGNELCYGTAKTPEGPFAYKGVIVSNGDLGMNGNTLATNYTGNNHGGLEVINGKTYIFWHRQTHGIMFSRQGCAEEVRISEDGTIPQVEITSCGLNGEPLPAKGMWPSYIACHITEKDREKVGNVVLSPADKPLPKLREEIPYVTEEEDEKGEKGLKPFIYNLREGAVAGFKYFRFEGDESFVRMELRGKAEAELRLDSPEGTVAASFRTDSAGWNFCRADLIATEGVHALYFRIKNGTADFASFEIG
jgi:hypothetical protein